VGSGHQDEKGCHPLEYKRTLEDCFNFPLPYHLKVMIIIVCEALVRITVRMNALDDRSLLYTKLQIWFALVLVKLLEIFFCVI
jgi:hypothetical protein